MEEIVSGDSEMCEEDSAHKEAGKGGEKDRRESEGDVEEEEGHLEGDHAGSGAGDVAAANSEQHLLPEDRIEPIGLKRER